MSGNESPKLLIATGNAGKARGQREQVRKLLLTLAQRRQRPGSGSLRTLLLERTARMPVPHLGKTLDPLPWAVVGAVATRLYMPERATQDLDIAVRPGDQGEVRQRLASAGFHYQGELSIGGSSWRSPEGIVVDVVELDQPWSAQALAEARDNLDPQGLPVLSLPYLVLMKFQAGRLQDLADVARMLGQATEAMLTAVRQLFATLAPQDSGDLESLIALGQLEMGPGGEDRAGSP